MESTDWESTMAKTISRHKDLFVKTSAIYHIDGNNDTFTYYRDGKL